jgi:hypothetical protein
LFLFERISASVVAENVAPAGRLAELAAGVGAGAVVFGVVGLLGDGDDAVGVGAGAGLVGLVRGFTVGFGVLCLGAGAGAAAAVLVSRVVVAAVSALGRSFNVALLSTGASCRSRFRLSADATSRLSPRPQAAAASSVSAASMVFDIVSSSLV